MPKKASPIRIPTRNKGYLDKSIAAYKKLLKPPKEKEMTPELIAQIAHEANRAYCESYGDNTQLHWEQAPLWQRESAISGVKFWIDNDGPTPRQLHNNWFKDKEIAGWVYGPIKDAELKTHPCMVDYDALPEFQRIKDSIFNHIVKALYTNLG